MQDFLYVEADGSCIWQQSDDKANNDEDKCQEEVSALKAATPVNII